MFLWQCIDWNLEVDPTYMISERQLPKETKKLPKLLLTMFNNNLYNNCNKHSLSVIKASGEDRMKIEMISTISCLPAHCVCVFLLGRQFRDFLSCRKLCLCPLWALLHYCHPLKSLPVWSLLFPLVSQCLCRSWTLSCLCYFHHTLKSPNLSASTCSFVLEGKKQCLPPSRGYT